MATDFIDVLSDPTSRRRVQITAGGITRVFATEPYFGGLLQIEAVDPRTLEVVVEGATADTPGKKAEEWEWSELKRFTKGGIFEVYPLPAQTRIRVVRGALRVCQAEFYRSPSQFQSGLVNEMRMYNENLAGLEAMRIFQNLSQPEAVVADIQRRTQEAVDDIAGLIDSTTDSVSQLLTQGNVYSIGREPRAGDAAGSYRVVLPDGVYDVSWDGQNETGRSMLIPSVAQAVVTTPTISTAQSSPLTSLARGIIVTDPVAGGTFSRDLNQSGGAVPGVRYQWGGVWFTRQRRGKEWRLTHLDAEGDYGGNWGAALLSLKPYLSANDKIIIPERTYLLKGGEPLLFDGIPGLTIEGYGAVLEFDPTLPPALQHAGFQFFNMTDLQVRGMTIDGRLDARTPLGGDNGATNFLNNLAILPGCDGVLLEDVQSQRSMMDGFYIGHSTAWLESISANVDGNWPKDVTLNRCYGYNNYRQDLSVTCGLGGAVYGGEFLTRADLGTAGKSTPPAAGIDLESEPRDGWYVKKWVVRDVKVSGKSGYGIMLDTNAIDCTVENCDVTDNALSGITTSDDAANNTIKGNRVRRNGSNTGELANIMLIGKGNKAVENNILCDAGQRGITATATNGGGGRLLSGNTVAATEAHGGMTTATIAVEGSNDTVVNNTTIGGYQSTAYYGVLRVASAGGVATGNRVIDPAGSNPAVTWVLECATERDNVSSGYTGAKYVTVTSKPLTPANTATYTVQPNPTQSEFNALLDEVRALKAAMKAGGITT